MTLTDTIIEGIFDGIADADYRKAPGVSQSSLKPLAQSPGHYKEALDNPSESTKAMIVGRICHQLVLTPDLPWRWAVCPSDMDRRTTDGREWTKANAGKEIVSHDEWLNIEGAVHAAKNHPMISLALDSSSRRELSCWRWFSLGGRVLRKGRIDLAPCGPALCDFKFVEDARERSFAKQVFDFKYYLQAAYYLDLYNENLPDGEEPKAHFIFFVVEKAPPFAISVFQLSPDAIGKGRAEYINLLSLHIDCEDKQEWSSYHRSEYSAGVKVLDLPKWAYKGEVGIF